MKKILAIGGAVMKTAREELFNVIANDHVEMLIHNGGSIFHDFQLALDKDVPNRHSYPLHKLIENWYWRSICEKPSKAIDYFLKTGICPGNTVTNVCLNKKIPVLLFTGLGCDFWHLFIHDWRIIAERAQIDFFNLCGRFNRGNFHYVCMGSAVIHPEVFIKAIAYMTPPKFTADVVDFKDMYRPLTRVAIYGHYYKMTHKEYLQELLFGGSE